MPTRFSVPIQVLLVGAISDERFADVLCKSQYPRFAVRFTSACNPEEAAEAIKGNPTWPDVCLIDQAYLNAWYKHCCRCGCRPLILCDSTSCDIDEFYNLALLGHEPIYLKQLTSPEALPLFVVCALARFNRSTVIDQRLAEVREDVSLVRARLEAAGLICGARP